MSPRKRLSISATERCEIKLERDMISVTRTVHEPTDHEVPLNHQLTTQAAVEEPKTVVKSRKPKDRCRDGPEESAVKSISARVKKHSRKKSGSSKIGEVEPAECNKRQSPSRRKKATLTDPTYITPPVASTGNMVWLRNESQTDRRTSEAKPKRKKKSSEKAPSEQGVTVNEKQASNTPSASQQCQFSNIGLINSNDSSPPLNTIPSYKSPRRRRSYTVCDGLKTPSLMSMVQAAKPLLPPLHAASQQSTAIFVSSDNDSPILTDHLLPGPGRAASAALSRARSFTIDPRDMAMTPPSPRKRWNKLSPLKSSSPFKYNSAEERNFQRQVSSPLLRIPTAATTAAIWH